MRACVRACVYAVAHESWLIVQVKNTSVAVISLVFAAEDGATEATRAGLGGFGHLIPAGEGCGRGVLGVIYDSDVFPAQVLATCVSVHPGRWLFIVL